MHTKNEPIMRNIKKSIAADKEQKVKAFLHEGFLCILRCSMAQLICKGIVDNSVRE